jgi:anti-sigma factor RsiW
MGCSPFDLRDYILNELADRERRLVETHIASCEGCREELDRLKATEAALLSVADEEIPRRIGFVSDRVFEPSPIRRWWQALWNSGPRLGFASAAMLSAAIMVFALTRPAPAPSVAGVAGTDLARVEAQLDARIKSAVAEAVAEAEARQEGRTRTQLAALEQRRTIELKAIELAVEQNLNVLERRYSNLKQYIARADTGAGQ